MKLSLITHNNGVDGLAVFFLYHQNIKTHLLIC